MLVDKPRFITKIWFSNKIERTFLKVYYQCKIYRRLLGMISEKFHTKIIDLTANEGDLYNSFDKGTKYDIRRSQVDGVIITEKYDIEQIITFYNNFAKNKKLDPIDLKNIRNSPYKHFTTAKINNETLVCHLYLLDKSMGRVRLLNSGTKVSDSNTAERALIGRANRFLHYRDMIYFKNLGYTEYDLGGYAFKTKNSSLNGINSFKDSFGGNLIIEYHYYPIIVWTVYFIKNKIKQVIKMSML